MKRRTSSVGPPPDDPPQSLQTLVEQLRTKLKHLESKQTAFVTQCVSILKERKLLLTARLSGEGGVVDAAFKREISDMTREKDRIEEDIQYILDLKSLSQRRGSHSHSGKALFDTLRSLETHCETAKSQSHSLLKGLVSEDNLRRQMTILQKQRETAQTELLRFNAVITQQTQEFITQIKALQGEKTALERQLTDKIIENASKYESVTIRLRRENEGLERQVRELAEKLDSAPGSPFSRDVAGLQVYSPGLSTTKTLDFGGMDTARLKRKLISVCKERDALKFWKDSHSSAITLMHQMREEVFKCHQTSQLLKQDFDQEKRALHSHVLTFLHHSSRLIPKKLTDSQWEESRNSLLNLLTKTPNLTINEVDLKMENENLKEAVNALNRQIEAYRSDYVATQQEIAKLKTEKTALIKAKQRESVSKSQYSEIVIDVNKRVNEFMHSISMKIVEILHKYEQKIEIFTIKIDNCAEKIKNMRKLTIEQNEMLILCNRKIDDLENVCALKETENSELRLRFEEKQRNSEQNVQKISEKLREKAEEWVKTEEMLMEEKEVSASLLKETQKLRKEVNNWKEKIKTLENSQFQQNYVKINQLESEISKLQFELETAKTEKIAEKSSFQFQLSQSESKFSLEIDKLRLNFDILSQSKLETELELSVTKSILSEIETMILKLFPGDSMDLVGKITILMTRLRQSQEEISEANKAINDFLGEGNCGELNFEGKLRKIVMSLNQEIGDLKLSKSNLTQLLHKIDAENRDFGVQIERMKAENEDLVGNFQRMLDVPRASIEFEAQLSVWEQEREELLGRFTREKLELIASNEAEIQYLKSQLAKQQENRSNTSSTEREETPNRAFYRLFRAVVEYSGKEKTEVDEVIRELEGVLVDRKTVGPFGMAAAETKETQTSFKYSPESFISLEEDISVISQALPGDVVFTHQSFNSHSGSEGLPFSPPFNISSDLGNESPALLSTKPNPLFLQYQKLETDLADELRTNSLLQQQLQLLKEEIQQKDKILRRASEQKLTANLEVLTEAYMKLVKALPLL